MYRSMVVVACSAALMLAGCSGSGSGSASASPSPPDHTALPATSKTLVTFQFNDVAIASGGSNTLRLGFAITNASDDPLLCDPSEFNIQLSDGTVIAADGSADDTCDPGSVDPHADGKATMYFDLPHAYTGPVIMFLVVNDAVVGQSTTSLH
ncbi:MAG TPA: hypothetical protein VEV38_09700 [Candidatus Eremiobacteraceae bacterium]|nr:hypothetical protein [Candidatus Eremiobacteraceae bacterium]